MEWLTQLRGSIVAVDTAPFIYFVERHPTYLPIVQPLFRALDEGLFEGVTSMLTVVEVLVHPWRVGNAELAAQYRQILLGTRNPRTMIVSDNIADQAARIRAIYNLKTPDAIQLATAVCAGASTFITNEAMLKPIEGLSILRLNELLESTT